MTQVSREFIAGTVSLSFVDTLGGRDGIEVERLAGPMNLGDWLVAAGLVDPPGPIAAPNDVEAARALREAIYRCGRAVTGRTAMPAADVATINAYAARPSVRHELTPEGAVRRVAPSIEAALSTVAADAIATLAEPLGRRIRLCPECRMMFLDNSRAGRRRWCSSAAGCGNRAKVRSHRARRAGAGG